MPGSENVKRSIIAHLRAPLAAPSPCVAGDRRGAGQAAHARWAPAAYRAAR